MKCILCNQRKAKRLCPAKGGLICAQCCGEKRVLQIECPENCGYLKAARERELADHSKRLQNMDPGDQGRNKKALQDYGDVIAHLEYVLAHYRLSVRSLKDKDVIRAADVLLSTYRTEDKGILYENSSDDLRIESLRRELHKVVESYRNPQGAEGNAILDPKNNRLPLRAAIDCMGYLRSMAAAYLQDRRSDSGYLDFLARMVPREEKRRSIVLP